MHVTCIIPGRMASSRFPGKPVKSILGLPMIEHVRRRVALCERLDSVVVATCDQEIKKVVEEWGGQAVMTSDQHRSCLDRAAEATASMATDVVVVVQGDEPLIRPSMLDRLLAPITEQSDIQCTNLCAPIDSDEEFNDVNVPKVVTGVRDQLLYISREPIPSRKKYSGGPYRRLKQLGIFAFRKKFLETYASLKPTPLEQIESVDINRCVEYGYPVQMIETKETSIGVDVPSDIARAEAALLKDDLLARYWDQLQGNKSSR